MDNPIKYVKDLFRRSPRAADTPDVPQPLSNQTGNIPTQSAQPVDQENEYEFIQDMNVGVHRQRRGFIIDGTEFASYQAKPRLVAGCGCVVGQIGETADKENNMKDKTEERQSSKEAAFELVKEQEIPKRVIGGVCKYCREEALTLVKKHELRLDEVDLYSTYCNFCQRTCSSCNRNTCKRHNLSFENPDGSISMLCPECQVTGSRQKLTHKFFGGIASFLLEHETTPPEKKPRPDNKYPDSFMFLAIFLAIACITSVFASAKPAVTSAISPSFSTSTSFSCSDNINQASIWSIKMNNIRDGPSDSKFLFDERKIRFPSLEPDETLLRLEVELRRRQLWHRKDIQRWYRVASCRGKYNRAYAIEKLKIAIEADRIEEMRHWDDPFRPLGPEVLLRQGELHLLDQVVDGMAWKVSRDALLRGTLVAGPQGSGKTRFIVSVGHQLVDARPSVNLTTIDPKGGVVPYAHYLKSDVVDISEISLDVSQAGKKPYSQWLREILPFIASQCSLIQSTALVLEAGNIALELRNKFIEKTGKNTELCLKDIYTCLSAVRDTDRGRRNQYLQAAQTALSRILNASGNLFACRRGIPISELFNRNIIITCSSLTDELACKLFVTYLLYWKFADSRDRPETNTLQNLFIIDDAQRFLSVRMGESGTYTPTTPLTHVLSVLRSSGCGLLVATQLPAQIDPGVISLSTLIVAIGGIHDVEGQQVIGNVMSLSAEQRKALVRLGCREAVGFCGAGAYRRPVHGWVPEVPDPEGA